MRTIAIDATPLLVRSAGIKGYLYHWIRALREAAGSKRIRTFPSLPDLGDLDHERSLTGKVRTYWGLLWLHAARHAPLLDLAPWDVFHATNFVRRAPRGKLLTTTLHDVTGWTLPGLHTSGNRRADEAYRDAVLRKAHGIIAVSENTRQDAIRHLGLKPERIVTIHSGVPEAYFHAQPRASAKPYVLSVGTIEPRKNLDRLLDAWAALPPRYREQWDLLFAGPAGWDSEKTLARIQAEARWLRYVPEADMPGLTAGADVVAYPSLYEGFGFPVAQAMAAGVAVLTSNVSALPEVAGDGALLVDPQSVTEIRDGLARLLDSTGLRQQLGVAGRARAQGYRWEICAQRSLEFFESLPL